MRRPSLVALLGACVLLLPVIIAQAASLNVNAGVLQTWVVDVDLEPPPTVNVSIELAEYKGNSGNSDEKRDSRVIGYALLEGQIYFVSYDKPNQIRDCPSVVPPPSSQTSPSFTASPDLTYVLCVQQAQQGNVTVRAGEADGPVVEPSTPSTAVTSSLMVPDESPSPVVDDPEDSRTAEPAVEPQETAPTAPEPAKSTEEADPDEPEVPVDETATAPEEQTTPLPEETTPAPTPQPCAWEVQEDDEGRTHLVEVCPDDATEGAEGEDAP